MIGIETAALALNRIVGFAGGRDRRREPARLAEHAHQQPVLDSVGERMRAGILRKIDRLLRWAPALLFAVALLVVHQELKDNEFVELSHSWRHVPWQLIAAAVLLTVVNYIILAGYDLLALRFTGHRIPLARVLLTSFIGYGISNNTGHAWTSGGSVRYRFYGRCRRARA
jgi:uncharacterized membrane protein YbhN (UPF0104 family)